MRHHICSARQLIVQILWWLLINKLREVILLLVNEGAGCLVVELDRQVAVEVVLVNLVGGRRGQGLREVLGLRVLQ